MFDRRKILKIAWTQYRRVAFKGQPFDRALFGRTLRLVWADARAIVSAERQQARRDEEKRVALAARPIVVPVLSPMEQRIDALKYLSARYRIDAMEREIRAEYAAA